MKYNKQLLLADLKANDGVIHGNSHYYNLFDCKTQKERDVVRNGVNRIRHPMRISGWQVDKNGNQISYTYTPTKAERNPKEMHEGKSIISREEFRASINESSRHLDELDRYLERIDFERKIILTLITVLVLLLIAVITYTCYA